MSPRIYCYDTEFLENGHTIELISIGITCHDGREYYAVNSDMPVDRITQHDWLMESVIPSLPGTKPYRLDGTGSWIWSLSTKAAEVKPHWVIANEVRDFITADSMGDRIELWADYGAYDHVALAQLFGPMIHLPTGIPMFTHELEQLKESLPGDWQEPAQTSGVHNALEDARHNMLVYCTAMNTLNYDGPTR